MHLLTASGAAVGLYTLYWIQQGQYITAFWLMGLAIFIDAIDGSLARKAQVKRFSAMDGALLDNIIDYVNYVLVPAYLFLLSDRLLPPDWRDAVACMVVIVSAYQFTQPDAKTKDHFFKGFPSYWNIVAFYLFFWQRSPTFNLWVTLIFALLVFVPIKYIYPSRLEYISRGRLLPQITYIATLAWGVATLGLLWVYPNTSFPLVAVSLGYVIFYFLLSLYRTLIPLR